MSSIENWEPITIEALAKSSGVDADIIESYFDEEFGGYDNYVQMCKDKSLLEKMDEIVAKP